MKQWVEDAPFLSRKQGKNTPTKKSRCGFKMKLPGEAIWI